MGKGSVECNRDGIICGFVGAVDKLEWVYGFWDNGFDVSHYQPFKALHGYRREMLRVGSHLGRFLVFLGTGTMVVCLKHVGITYSDREIENVSEDTCQLVRVHNSEFTAL